jgi:hypothetical protein
MTTEQQKLQVNENEIRPINGSKATEIRSE